MKDLKKTLSSTIQKVLNILFFSSSLAIRDIYRFLLPNNLMTRDTHHE